MKTLPDHNNFLNSHQLHSQATMQQSNRYTPKKWNFENQKGVNENYKNGNFKRLKGKNRKGGKWKTSLWPLEAAKWRGELRPPKVEYFARQGLNSKSIFASTKSPSLAADTNLSPEAEHPNEFPISLFLSLSLWGNLVSKTMVGSTMKLNKWDF